MRKFLQYTEIDKDFRWLEITKYRDGSETIELAKTNYSMLLDATQRTPDKKISEINQLLTVLGQPSMSDEEKSWFTSHLGMSVSSKVAEPIIFNVNHDQIESVSKIRDRLNTINKTFEAKSECGTIRLLDHVANGLDWVASKLNNSATYIRHYTWKTTPPCVINFKKAK
jgi:hypothetical protein